MFNENLFTDALTLKGEGRFVRIFDYEYCDREIVEYGIVKSRTSYLFRNKVLSNALKRIELLLKSFEHTHGFELNRGAIVFNGRIELAPLCLLARKDNSIPMVVFDCSINADAQSANAECLERSKLFLESGVKKVYVLNWREKCVNLVTSGEYIHNVKEMSIDGVDKNISLDWLFKDCSKVKEQMNFVLDCMHSPSKYENDVKWIANCAFFSLLAEEQKLEVLDMEKEFRILIAKANKSKAVGECIDSIREFIAKYDALNSEYCYALRVLDGYVPSDTSEELKQVLSNISLDDRYLFACCAVYSIISGYYLMHPSLLEVILDNCFGETELSASLLRKFGNELEESNDPSSIDRRRKNTKNLMCSSVYSELKKYMSGYNWTRRCAFDIADIRYFEVD